MLLGRNTPFLFEADTGDGGGSGQAGEGGQQGQQGGTQGSTGGQQGDNNTPGPVPYERFKEVNDQFNQLKTQWAQLQDAQKQADEQKLADEKKWQQLAEQRENELKAEKAARLRLEVAGRKGIPSDMVDRLRGETVEDLEKDADTLLQFLKPASGPGVPPAGKGGSPKPLDLSKMSPKEIRENTDKIVKQMTGG